jgi:hypothetical protein
MCKTFGPDASVALNSILVLRVPDCSWNDFALSWTFKMSGALNSATSSKVFFVCDDADQYITAGALNVLSDKVHWVVTGAISLCASDLPCNFF